MLVLNGKSGEDIRIGPDVRITVLAVQGNEARLGISAPTGVSIWRDELVLDSVDLPVSPFVVAERGLSGDCLRTALSKKGRDAGNAIEVKP
jgi:carbon storage regulator CsrA